FSGGIVANASTTIGAGTQATGLTISGGATTTGNSLVQGTIAASGAGTSTVSNGMSVGTFAQTGSATSTFTNGLQLTNGCISINGSCLSLATISGLLAIANGGTNAISF